MKRKQYEKSFKVMIVELLNNGHTATQIQQDYGLNTNMVYRWRKEFNDKQRPSFTGQSNARLTEQEQEIIRLKKWNK